MTQNEINHKLKEQIDRNTQDLIHEHDRINYCISKIKELEIKDNKPSKPLIDSQLIVLILQIGFILFMVILVIKILCINI